MLDWSASRRTRWEEIALAGVALVILTSLVMA